MGPIIVKAAVQVDFDRVDRADFAVIRYCRAKVRFDETYAAHTVLFVIDTNGSLLARPAHLRFRSQTTHR